MVTRWSRLRTLVALLLFSTANGGAQVFDALVFHSHPVQALLPRLEGADHSHADRCELGAPIASPPPVTPPDLGDRFEPRVRRVRVARPIVAPCPTLFTTPLGSRAPPLSA
jgi:hypothetical protein